MLAFGLFLLSRMGVTTSFGITSVYMVVVGLGVGLVMQVLVVAVQNSVPYEQLGVATSTATFFRTIGGAFGVSVLNAVFNNRLFAELAKSHVPPAALRKILNGSSIVVNPAAIDHLPPAVRAPIRVAFSHSLQTVFLVAVPFAVLAFVLGWLMKEIPLRTTAFRPTSPDSNGNAQREREGRRDDREAEPGVPAEVADVVTTPRRRGVRRCGVEGCSRCPTSTPGCRGPRPGPSGSDSHSSTLVARSVAMVAATTLACICSTRSRRDADGGVPPASRRARWGRNGLRTSLPPTLIRTSQASTSRLELHRPRGRPT